MDCAQVCSIVSMGGNPGTPFLEELFMVGENAEKKVNDIDDTEV